MARSLADRVLRLGLILALLGGVALSGVGVQAQGQADKLAFSVLDQDKPVHIAQVAFGTANGMAAVSSTVGFTQRSGLLRLEPGQALKRTLFLGNETAQSQAFSVLLLLDDSQAQLTLDGQAGPRHALTLEADSQRRLDMAFPPLEEEGLHNFLLLVFYEYTGDQGALSGLFTPYVDSLVVGTGQVPQTSVARPDETAFLEGHSVGAKVTVPPPGITLSRGETPTQAQDLLREPLRLSGGTAFSYFIHVRNGQPRRGRFDEFVLVTLWDGLQVPVDARADGPVAHFTLPLNGLADLPAQLEVPPQPGAHSLDVLAIRNPYGLQTGLDASEVLHQRFAVEVR